MTPDAMPTAERLRALLAYEPETGVLTWRERTLDTIQNRSARAMNAWNARYAGTEAFTTGNGKGYLTGKINDRRFRAHRVIWVIATGERPIADIDHINGNRSDNRLVNLREATRSQNNANRKAVGVSKYLGVCPAGRKWVASIRSDGRRKHLGYFHTEADAARAYDAAAAKTHGDFANLNFLEGFE